jgi:hypothetical protein
VPSMWMQGVLGMTRQGLERQGMYRKMDTMWQARWCATVASSTRRPIYYGQTECCEYSQATEKAQGCSWNSLLLPYSEHEIMTGIGVFVKTRQVSIVWTC